MFEMYFVKGFFFRAIGGWGIWRQGWEVSGEDEDPDHGSDLNREYRNTTEYGAIFESYHLL